MLKYLYRSDDRLDMSKEQLTPKVGLYANKVMYTDIHPFEIVEVNPSGKSIKIREMNNTLDPSWKPDITPGGFSGHCLNNREQRWFIEPNPGNPLLTIRKTKRGWGYKGERFSISEKPVRFHDYNF